MRASEAATARLAAQQHGVVSRRQALEAGMTRDMVARRVRKGAWLVALPGVYRVAGAPKTWLAQIMAAVLWGGRDAIVTHRSAARLLGLEGFASDHIEIA